MAGPADLKRKVKPSGHFIKSRKKEIFVGVLLFAVGAMLLWDAFEGRNKNMPWPFSGMMPL